MTPEEITQQFTRQNGDFLFARWGRPLSPVLFGVEDETVVLFKSAIEAVVAIAGHETAETDPELGANVMIFFIRDWQEVLDTPKLDALIPELKSLVVKLVAADANQYRIFRFDKAGAIQACFVFLRMDKHLDALPGDALALGQAAQLILLWSDTFFSTQSPLALLPDGTAILRPEVGTVIQAAYHPTLPTVSDDPSHAFRIFARLPREMQQ